MTSADLARLKGEIALLEACEPQRQASRDAKEAVREAVYSGDPEALAVAREQKNAAALALRATRQWLRREAALKQLPRDIARIERTIANKEYDDEAHLARLRDAQEVMRQEVPRLEVLVAETRAGLEALGADLSAIGSDDDGDSDVVSISAPVVTARGKANKAGGA
ncbi:hypothetical protein [Acrocarpospora sp. B8E8]|uniref:hypothetical protein n=1 Tax=Acrocarpospora sp. B8E8 TaxID=3153572 RepID=UPI00325CBDBD